MDNKKQKTSDDKPSEAPAPAVAAPSVAIPPPAPVQNAAPISQPPKEPEKKFSSPTVSDAQTCPYEELLKQVIDNTHPLSADHRRRMRDFVPVEPDLTQFSALVNEEAHRVARQNSRVINATDTPNRVKIISQACWYTFYRSCGFWESTVRPMRTNQLRPNLLDLPMAVAYAVSKMRPWGDKNESTLFISPKWVERWMEREHTNSANWRNTIDSEYITTLAVCGGSSKIMGVMPPNLESTTSILANTVYIVNEMTYDGSEIVQITGPILSDIESMFVCKLKLWRSRYFSGYFDPQLSESNSVIRPQLMASTMSSPLDWKPNWNNTIRALTLMSKSGTINGFH